MEIIWDKNTLSQSKLEALRDTLPSLVSKNFSRIDKKHIVKPHHVEVHITRKDELDRIGADLYITILARFEKVRDRHRLELTRQLTKDIMDSQDLPANTLVETVLTNHTTIYSAYS